ncbi:uncharacterized protein [Gossypium hirsutum]|uniref:Uncharacterized protein n=1 Tax=Gossypium hirsutum TaxID=3635 RepID=A0ABM2ZEH0_GOSHI|nr:uncharacterized protein LOC107962085 [Gossypium hirsutum]
MPSQKILKPILSSGYHFFFSFDGSVYWESCSFKNWFIFFSYTFLLVLFFPIPFSIWFMSPFNPLLSFSIPRDTHYQLQRRKLPHDGSQSKKIAQRPQQKRWFWLGVN